MPKVGPLELVLIFAMMLLFLGGKRFLRMPSFLRNGFAAFQAGWMGVAFEIPTISDRQEGPDEKKSQGKKQPGFSRRRKKKRVYPSNTA